MPEIVQVFWNYLTDWIISDAHQGLIKSPKIIFHFPDLKSAKTGQNSHQKWNLPFRSLLDTKLISDLPWVQKWCWELVWIVEEERKFGAGQKISPIWSPAAPSGISGDSFEHITLLQGEPLKLKSQLLPQHPRKGFYHSPKWIFPLQTLPGIRASFSFPAGHHRGWKTLVAFCPVQLLLPGHLQFLSTNNSCCLSPSEHKSLVPITGNGNYPFSLLVRDALQNSCGIFP